MKSRNLQEKSVQAKQGESPSTYLIEKLAHPRERPVHSCEDSESVVLIVKHGHLSRTSQLWSALSVHGDPDEGFSYVGTFTKIDFFW